MRYEDRCLSRCRDRRSEDAARRPRVGSLTSDEIRAVNRALLVSLGLAESERQGENSASRSDSKTAQLPQQSRHLVPSDPVRFSYSGGPGRVGIAASPGCVGGKNSDRCLLNVSHKRGSPHARPPVAISRRRPILGGLTLSPVLAAYRLGVVSSPRARPIVSRVGFQGVPATAARAIGHRYASEVLPAMRSDCSSRAL